jgi:hypothetical protein
MADGAAPIPMWAESVRNATLLGSWSDRDSDADAAGEEVSCS